MRYDLLQYQDTYNLYEISDDVDVAYYNNSEIEIANKYYPTILEGNIIPSENITYNYSVCKYDTSQNFIINDITIRQYTLTALGSDINEFEVFVNRGGIYEVLLLINLDYTVQLNSSSLIASIYIENGVYLSLVDIIKVCYTKSSILIDLVSVFNADTTNGVTPLLVNFTDESTGSPTGWHWDFGDGNTSTLQNPTHTYTTSGIYTVALTINRGADNNTLTKNNYIVVNEASSITAAFTADNTIGNTPLLVNFTDESTGSPTGWHWDFGDGNTSTLQNPTHTYTTSGIYTVALTINRGADNNTLTKNNYIVVNEASSITAAFTADGTSGSKPFIVNFTDESTGSPTGWLWTFGDGNTSTLQNPTHTYNTGGIFTVGLIITKDAENNILIKNNYITVVNYIDINIHLDDPIPHPPSSYGYIYLNKYHINWDPGGSQDYLIYNFFLDGYNPEYIDLPEFTQLYDLKLNRYLNGGGLDYFYSYRRITFREDYYVSTLPAADNTWNVNNRVLHLRWYY